MCGSNLAPSVAVASNKGVSGARIPAVTLSLPVVFGLAVLLLVAGAAAVYAVLNGMGDKSPVAAAAATITATPTTTATATIEPSVTPTPTLASTWTPLPPVEYKVASNDTCLAIAYAFHVSVNSIVILNGLSADCTNLSVGQVLKIPQPTPTPSPEPTRTLNPTEQVQAECNTVAYTVKENDTLGSIAANYGVSNNAIVDYNAMSSDVVYVGQKITIPLCEQSVSLATATPTAVPPYPSPNLLLPADGASFTNPADVITLQWSSVGNLRQNEAYAVTIEDVTEGNARKLVEYVTDTKFIVPEILPPGEQHPARLPLVGLARPPDRHQQRLGRPHLGAWRHDQRAARIQLDRYRPTGPRSDRYPQTLIP